MPWFGKGRRELPADWVAALERTLQPIDPTGQVAEFVLTGQDVKALKSLNNARVLWVHARWSSAALREAMEKLYAGFGGVDAMVLRRWGMVLDASQGFAGGGAAAGVSGHWPVLMLQQAAAAVPAGPLPVTFADLERIAAVDGTPAADLIRMAFTASPYSRFRELADHGHLSRLPGFAEAVVAHRDVAASLLASGSVDERVAAVALPGVLGDAVLGALAEPLAEAATSTSAKVRDAARPLIARIGSAVIDPLRRLAIDGTPERRGYALELLAARPDQREWAVKTAGADRAASVRALSARWETADVPAETGAEMPPLPSWSLSAADAELVANQLYEAMRQGVESSSHRAPAQFHRDVSESPPFIIARIAGLLAADGPPRIGATLAGIPAPAVIANQVAGVIRQRWYPASTAVQVMAILGWLDQPGFASRVRAEVIEDVHARTGGPDLLTLQRMFDAAGADGRALVWMAYSASWGVRPGRNWPDDDVWPFVAHNLDWIMEEPRSGRGWNVDEYAHFAAIATLPEPPARLIDRLYAMATGPRIGDRTHAQAALERDPRRTARATAALRDGKADVRLAAAQWLVRIADPSALPELSAAWKKEKQDLVRGALLDALIAIGEDAGGRSLRSASGV